MGIALFVIYVLALLGIGLSRRARLSGQDSFFVNARQSGQLTVAASILAACIGASSTIGMVGLSFHVGMPAFWWLGSGVVGLIILSRFFAAKVRETGCYTLSDIVVRLLGVPAEKLTSVVVVCAWTAIVTAELVACTTVLQTLLHVEKLTALIIGCLLICSLTVMGGQSSIIRLDRLQFGIVFGTITVLLIWSMLVVPTEARHVQIELTNQAFTLNKVMYFCLILGGSYIVCPMLYGRVLSAENQHAARTGVLMAAVALGIVAIMIVYIGLYAQRLIPLDTPNDEVLMTLVNTILPAWLATCIYVFLLCVVVSAANACLFAASSALSRHLFKKETISASRFCSVVLMLIAAVLTLTNQGILSYLLMANNIYVCSIVIPVMMCFIFKKTAVSVNQSLMAVGMVIAGMLGLISAITDQYVYAYAGLCSAFLLTFISFKNSKSSTGEVNL